MAKRGYRKRNNRRPKRPGKGRRPLPWTGPTAEDLEPDGVTLRHHVPGHRWPYGPPKAHQECCQLFQSGLFCDCAASDASDTEWGMAHQGTGTE